MACFCALQNKVFRYFTRVEIFVKKGLSDAASLARREGR